MKPSMTTGNAILNLVKGADYIGVGVCCVVHDGKGKVLLMKRGKGSRDEQGKWDLCGGAIEFGESINEAVHRELKEELCTKALEIKFLTAYDAHREHEGAKTHWVQLLHAVRVNPSKVKIGEPHKFDEIGWFTFANLPEPRHSQFDKSLSVAVLLKLIK